jgi:hypothetical protein
MEGQGLSTWPDIDPYAPDPDAPASANDRATIKALTSKLRRMLSAQQTVSPAASATVTPNMSLGWTLKINMPAASITLANPINAQPGDFLILVVVESNVGGGLITWGANYRQNFTLSTAANAIDTALFRYADTETRWYQIGAPALGIA